MSQVDNITYLPTLFWFIIIFTFLYFNIFSWIFRSIYYVITSRKIYFQNLLNLSYKLLYLLIIIKMFIKESLKKSMISHKIIATNQMYKYLGIASGASKKLNEKIKKWKK